MAQKSRHPRVIVTDGSETGVHFAEPGEQAFRAGVMFTNRYYEDACLIADAFELACTEAYIGKAFASMFPGGWKEMGIELVKGLAESLLWVVAGAGIGATFGFGLGLLLPPAEPLTIAGGAALGAAIAQWAMVGAGLVMAGYMTFQIGSISIELFGRGVREALDGNKEIAAAAFAKAIALVVGAVIPVAIVCVLFRGAGRMMQSQTARYMVNGLTRKIGASQILTAAQARAVGLLDIERRAISESTHNIFKVFRGCNPSRVAAIDRAGGLGNVHFKPGYLVDFKSYKEGAKAGEYVIEKGEMDAYIKGHYDSVPLGDGKFRLSARSVPHGDGTYLQNTNPRTGGAWLDGHILEPTSSGGKSQYLVRHVDDKTFVPDIDRLLYAEIGQTGRLGKSGVLRNKQWLANDDPREVMHWNERVSQAIFRLSGERLDWRAFQHGKSGDYLKPHKVTGEVGPGWPSRDAAGVYQIENESVVICVNGNMFATDWHGLATFCKSLELLNFKFPWAKALIH